MGDEVDILKLDVDENPELASQLQVRKKHSPHSIVCGIFREVARREVARGHGLKLGVELPHTGLTVIAVRAFLPRSRSHTPHAPNTADPGPADDGVHWHRRLKSAAL